MPIIKANPNVVRVACAICDTERDVATADLTLGNDWCPDVIAIPGACPTCGATECVMRTWDTTPEWARGSHHDLHRRAVNALAQHLIARGRAHAQARTDSPPDMGDWDVTDVPRPKRTEQG